MSESESQELQREKLKDQLRQQQEAQARADTCDQAMRAVMSQVTPLMQEAIAHLQQVAGDYLARSLALQALGFKTIP